MASANTHLKKQANNILDRGRLLPQEFSDHVDMLKRYETSSLQNFRDNNLSFWGNIDDQHLGNSIALLSNDKNYLIVITQRNRIHIYNFSDKTPVLEQSPYTGLEFANGITCATLCNTNKSLFVGCNDGSLGEIDLSNGVIKQIITVSTRSILSLTISYNEEKLIFCDSERVYILDVESKSLSEYCSGSGYEFVSFLGNNNYVFTGGGNFRDGWSYKIQSTFDQNSSFKEKHSFAHFSARVIGNTEYYMVLSNQNSSSVFNGPSFTNCQIFKFNSRDQAKDTPFCTVKLEAYQSADFDQIQFHITRDNRFLLCYSNTDSTLYIYHLKTEKHPQLAKIPNLALARSKAIFAQDDSCLVLVAPNGEVRVCKFLLEPNHIINEFLLFNYSEVLENSLIISDDGNLIAYFDMDKDVKVWDIKREKCVLIVRKERFDKKLSSATMKFSQPNEIRIEYRFQADDSETLQYAISQRIRPEMSETGTEIQKIDFNQLAAERILNNKDSSPKSPKSPKKSDDENEPLNNDILKCKKIASHNELEKSAVNPTKQDISKEPSKELVESRSKHIPPQGMLDEDNSWYKKRLSQILSQEKCEIVVMSHGKTHLFLGFEDSTVEVYNYPALQQVSSWRNEQRILVSIATSRNDRFILTLYGDGYVEIRDFNFVPPSTSRSNMTLVAPQFYSFERHFNLDKLSWEESFKNSQNYYLSREQSVLHIKCLANSDDLPKLKYNQVSNIPFLRDMYNRTPLHYLLSHSKLDYRHMDAVATYILDYMEELKKNNKTEYQYVLNSLNEILPILILKLQPNLAAKYIDMVAPVRAITEKELETNVFSINKKIFFPGDEFKDSEMAARLPRGQEQIIYKELGLKIDYKIQSKDILEYTMALSELEVEDLFKLPAIIHLVDYIWTFTRRMNIMLFNWWMILMILLSVCVGLGERCVGLEITILVLASFGVIIETAQAIVLKSRYWNAMWNQVDLVSIILIYIYIIFKMSGFNDELAENWIAAFMIFTVYIRLAGYLRLFKETRILIEVIVNITRDMISFLIIMILITIGFSIIFLKFLRNDQDFYLWHLYYSYQLWYGNTDGIPSDSPSVLVLECAIMFIMPVMLLNLLVTLMGESREKVKENEILANSKTRLAMSIEALAIMRIVWGGFWSKKTEAKRVGTFLYVGVPKTEETETTEKTSEIAELQKQIQDMMEIVKSSKEEIAKISQETSEIKAQMVQPLPKIELDFDTKQKSRGFY